MSPAHEPPTNPLSPSVLERLRRRVRPRCGESSRWAAGAAAWARASSRQNLAVYFAQLGKPRRPRRRRPDGREPARALRPARRRVEPDVRRGRPSRHRRRALVPTAVPGLSLLPAAHDAVDARRSPCARGARSRWLARLRALPAEYLVIDVGPGARRLRRRPDARGRHRHRRDGPRAARHRDDVPLPARRVRAPRAARRSRATASALGLSSARSAELGELPSPDRARRASSRGWTGRSPRWRGPRRAACACSSS